MKPFEISDNVFYTGVNDRTTDLFEGLWPLPYGVTYNTYVIKGEKTALVDGVSIHSVNSLLTNINSHQIDFLIVNHMEPDHSAAIPGLCHKFPEMKIVCNAKAEQMVKGFYGIDNPDRFIIVKEGDKLDLGEGKVLQFFMTPMVHWPETMMTLLEKDSILFSGDGFGSFGALNGNPVDGAEEEWSRRKLEMRRYYAAIIAKYGKPVQHALAKLSSLSAKYICSTHGPVWHKRAAEVMRIYDDMSAGRTEDGVVIVYGSMYGNTSSVAELAARRLNERGIKNVRIYDAGRTDISRILADIWTFRGFIVGSPTYSMNLFPPIEALLKALEVRDLKNRVTAAFGSYAWAPAAPRLIADRLSALGLEVCATVSMRMSMNEQTALDTVAMADAVADKILNADA